MMGMFQGRLHIWFPPVFGLFIVNRFIGSPLLDDVIGILAMPMLVIAFMGAAGLFRILGGVFTVTGAGMFLYSGLPISELPGMMIATMPLLSFLTVLPWMNSVVRSGRFDRRINDLTKVNASHLGTMYTRSSFSTYLLAMFINLSALSLSQDVLRSSLKHFRKRLRDSFISRVTLRAFTLALLWSPMEIMVAITVDTTGVSYLAFLPWLFLASVSLLVIDWFWNWLLFRRIPNEKHTDDEMKPIVINWRVTAWKMMQLVVALGVFLTAVVTIGNVFSLNFILSVTLVILPFSFGWALIMGRFRSFIHIGWGTWKHRTNHLQNFVVLFLSLALFSESLNETPFLAFLQMPFEAASETPLLILLLVQFTYLALSMIGVHPIATIAILGEILQPLFAVINPLSIGMVLIMGALATATVGTYGVTVTMTAMNTMQNPYRITLRNMPFALLCGSMGTLIGFLLL
ncbi:hypothetical protein [Salisediminibacterium selenitireducens]|uniref:Citrate transporter n=1 Tax=Bacillus selenitireducens (strain ATCC 700615 / DSM 15326 / MLS10) TaxID=439292 RepID=D6XZK0_BACIE|nr:hypothetical protein [Salisediminibacterium selenitireducens]ADH98374.1 hypothetical protein Bsel_0848 [[Bacillus] selenitireducens MLS10]